MLCLSRFPLPARRVPRCVWRAVLSGCPLPSLAGTPFHAVCAFRELGPVALLVVPACPLRVCALALPRRPLPPPWVVWRAHLARSRHWALVGPFKVVRAPLRVLPRSLAPSGVLWGGGGPVPVPPYLAWGCGGGGRASPEGVPSTVARRVGGQLPPVPRLPADWAGCWGPLPTCCGRGHMGVGALHCSLGLHALWGLPAAGVVGGHPPTWLWALRPPWGGSVAFVCRGVGWGGGGGVRRAPRLCGPGGGCRAGGRSASFHPFPLLGRQQSGCHWRRSVHGGRGPPYHSSSCSPAFTGRDLCGVLVRWRGLACSSRFLWVPAAGAGGRATLRLLSRAGGGGTIPPASGGGGRGPRGLRAGGGGGGVGVVPRPPCSPSGWPPAVPHPGPSLVGGALPPACACGRGRGAAPGWGGMRGGPRTAPLGAPADLNPPSAVPEWAVVMGGSWGARPPYCSGAPPCAAPRLGPRAAPARWCGLACRPRPPREQAAGGAGARGVQVQPHPPPPRRCPFWGRGGVPSAPGGQRVAPVALKLGGGERGGGWGAAPPPPRPVGRRPAIRCLRRAPPGYTRAVGVAGRPRASGAVRSAANGSVQPGGGGGGPPSWFAPPSSPGRPLQGLLRLRRPGRRRSAVSRHREGRAGACLGRGAP